MRLGPPGLEVALPSSSGGGSVDSEWWQYPAALNQQNARNEDFLSDVLDPAWAWWKDPTAGSALTATTADNNVTLTMSSSPATKPRYKVNDQRKPSWMQLQVPKAVGSSDVIFAAGSWWLLKPLTPTANDCYYTRTQIPMPWVTSGSANAGLSQMLVLMAATGGAPDKNNAIIIGDQGLGSNTGGTSSLMYSVVAGAASIRPLAAFDMSVGGFSSFGIRRRASTNWSGWYGAADSGAFRTVEEFSLAFTPAFVGWWIRVQPVAVHNPIFSFDLLRCPADADALPL
jgi:hypothetical protein